MKNNLIPVAAMSLMLIIAGIVAGQSVDTTDGSESANATPVKRAPATGTTWTGFYIGAYGGGALNRADASTTTVFTSSGYFLQSSVNAVNAAGGQSIKPNGFTGGGTVGYNHQSGAFIIGAEADFGSASTEEAKSSTTTYPCCSPSTFTITQVVKTRWLFTARPRIGVGNEHAFVYGTGGLAVTDIRYVAAFSDNFRSATESGATKQNKAGWTLGGGGEFRIGNSWSVKGEYLYADFGNVGMTSSNLNANVIIFQSRAAAPELAYPSNVFTHSADVKTHYLRFGFNFHF